jgi:hypothetical protein
LIQKHEKYEKAFENQDDNEVDSIIAETKKLMNSYYRFCALEERLLYLVNDEETANSRYTQEQEEKAERWRERLQAWFGRYGMKLAYYGWCPRIESKSNQADRIETYFYK